MKKGKMLLSALLMLVALAFSACNFGEDLPAVNGDYVVVPNEEVRPLPADFTTRKAISYSGYREGQSPATGIYPSETEILQDLNMLNSMGYTLLRLYDTSTHAARVLSVIKNNGLDMKVMLGVWIEGSRDVYNGRNTANCDQAVVWATGDYIDQIVAVSVGNECMVDWNTFGWATPPEDIAYYVSYVREKITQPVTVDDNWEPWSLENEDGKTAYANVYMVAEAVDFIALHTYALADAEWGLWDYKQETIAEENRAAAMMDAAVDFAKSNYYAAKDALANLGINKPIVIGETGWKSKGDSLDIGHPVNQRMYFDRMNTWMVTDPNGPKTSFYFEAFDEPWKGGDNNWGYFNVDREAKYIVYSDPDWSSLPFAIADDKPFELWEAAKYIPLFPIHIVDNSHNTFYIFADDVTTTSGYNGQLCDDTAATENLKWEAWENNSTGGVDLEDSSANGEDTELLGDDTVAVIQPVILDPPLDFGWGMMALMRRQGFDLSAFSTGSLKFRIKTSYSNNLEIGFQTGRDDDQDGMDLFITIDPTDNTNSYVTGPDGNNWYDISIPIQDLITAAKPGFEMPTDTTVNLAKVYTPFVIADRHNVTNDGSDTAQIWVDQIRWEK